MPALCLALSCTQQLASAACRPPSKPSGHFSAAATCRQPVAAPQGPRLGAAAHTRRLPPPAGLRAVESFEHGFSLDEQQQQKLDELLYSDLFGQQVARDCKLPEGTQVEFTGVLFQPVPWSPTSRKGMPQEIEEAYYGKEEFTFINVPPVFMFQAKIFQPPRLCAIYKRKDSPPA